MEEQRVCVDCGADISGRAPHAYLCGEPRVPSDGLLRVNLLSCSERRQRAARRANYRQWKAQHPGAKSRVRLNGTVGKEATCSCGVTFVKRGGNHRFCDACGQANNDFHHAVWNLRHPNRPHGPALNGVWSNERAVAA